MEKSITPAELDRRRASGDPVLLVDVRTPVEFRQMHAPHSVNIPLDRLSQETVAEAAEAADGPVYLTCRTGRRATTAAKKLADAGMTDLVRVEGGMEAWEAAGLPVVRDKTTISLERQVRIAAGSLVFTGGLLSLLVHPHFVAIPVFVGAGLIFAGLSGTCGMGMLLAKMPWNRQAS